MREVSKEYVKIAPDFYVKEKSFSSFSFLDSLILDIDGVILDVTSSFRATISKTVQYFFSKVIGLEDDDTLLLPEETQLFKLVDGFNNDFDLTYAAVLFYLFKLKRYGAKSISELKAKGEFLSDFLSLLKSGGGLKAAEDVIFGRLSVEEGEEVRGLWKKELIKQVFQEHYGGIDYCKAIYGFSPEIIKEKGLVNEEKVIADKRFIEKFLPRVGILTGRTKGETEVALKRAGLVDKVSSEFILVDEGDTRKPDPQTLAILSERMKTRLGIYVGDVMDDLRVVKNFSLLSTSVTFFSGIIDKENQKIYLEEGADIVAGKTNDLLKFLLSCKEERR